MSGLDAVIYSKLVQSSEETQSSLADIKAETLLGLAAAAKRREELGSALSGNVAGVLNDLRARLPDARLSSIDQIRALLNGVFKTEFMWRGSATINMSSGQYHINLPGWVDWNRARLDYQVCPGIYMSGIGYGNGSYIGGAASFSCYIEPLNPTQLRATLTGIPWTRTSEVGCVPVVTWHIQQFFL